MTNDTNKEIDDTTELKPDVFTPEEQRDADVMAQELVDALNSHATQEKPSPAQE